MTATMLLLHRRLPRHERYQLPPEKITGEFAKAVDLESAQTEPARTVATALAHLSYGAAAGFLYSGILGAADRNTAAGITYGLAVWAGSYFGLMPALGLHEPATRHPRRRNAMMAAAHVVWGASMATALRARPPAKVMPSSPDNRGGRLANPWNEAAKDNRALGCDP